jgi:hypothetical protein
LASGKDERDERDEHLDATRPFPVLRTYETLVGPANAW